MIWKTRPSADLSALFGDQHMDHHLGIEFTEVGDDYLKARMPVNEKTRQPYGLLHGGASCVLAESLGSAAGACCVEMGKQIVVGLEINANHISSVKEGYVYGTARPLHIGRSTQVWEIKITNENEKLVCVSRLTLAVKDLK
jgi:1,4-dihydroxy-2-naphthoyl-CoA hydrolase